MMASLVGTCRRIGDTPRRWFPAHLLLYLGLDLATLAVLNAGQVSGDLPVASRVLAVGFHVVVGVWWTAPLHVAALVAAAGGLALLSLSAGLRPVPFRAVALAVFVLPALLLAAVVPAAVALVGMHVVMGLAVVRPRWPDALPSPDQHRW